MLEDAADVRQEAHVEHPVGLVENENFEPFELGVFVLEVVEQATRGGDDHVDAAAEGVLLRPHADAAIDRRAGEGSVHREVAQMLVDLRRELAGRGEDQRARDAALLAHQPVEDRQQEGRALAAAGHRAGEDVAALEGRRDRVVLDRGGAGEAQRLHALEQIGVKVERGKGHATTLLSVRRVAVRVRTAECRSMRIRRLGG